MGKLTETFIKKLKPSENGKPYKKPDEKGLFIHVSSKGIKSWRLEYRLGNTGKRVGLKLGPYPELSLEEAREIAVEQRKKLISGIDPRIERKTLQDALILEKKIFEEVARDWFALVSSDWTKGYSLDMMQRMERNIFSRIGDMPMRAITDSDCVEVVESISMTGRKDTAVRMKQVLMKIFAYAKTKKIIDVNPTLEILWKDVVSKPKSKRYATVTSPREMEKVLTKIFTYHSNRTDYSVMQAMKLAPYLFLRPTEVAHLSWDEVDFYEKVIRIKENRMKMGVEHIVPMSQKVFDTLSEIKAVTGRFKYVFASSFLGYKSPINAESIRKAMRRAGVLDTELTTHGLRHMASTWLNEKGYNSDAVEKQLSHNEKNRVKATYNLAQYMPDRIQIMQDWSDFIEGIERRAENETA